MDQFFRSSILPHIKIKITIAIALALMLAIAGCNFPSSKAIPSETAFSAIPSSFPSGDENDAQGSSARKVLLYTTQVPEDLAILELQDAIADLAHQSDLDFEKVTTIQAEDIQDGVSIVFFFQDDPGITELATKYPDVQFIAIGIPGITPSSNVSVLLDDGLRTERKAFLAGYIAALIAEDWRAGLVSCGEDGDIDAIETGFSNGARYFCGSCQPAFPPFYEYPQYYNLSSNGTDWSTIISLISDNHLEVIYLAPVAEFETYVNEWMQVNSVFIGDSARPEIVPADQWVAVIRYSAIDSLQANWSALVSGGGGLELQWELQIENVNRNLLSIGREQLALEMIQDLEAGFIDPGYQPELD